MRHGLEVRYPPGIVLQASRSSFATMAAVVIGCLGCHSLASTSKGGQGLLRWEPGGTPRLGQLSAGGGCSHRIRHLQRRYAWLDDRVDRDAFLRRRGGWSV